MSIIFITIFNTIIHVTIFISPLIIQSIAYNTFFITIKHLHNTHPIRLNYTTPLYNSILPILTLLHTYLIISTIFATKFGIIILFLSLRSYLFSIEDTYKIVSCLLSNITKGCFFDMKYMLMYILSFFVVREKMTCFTVL